MNTSINSSSDKCTNIHTMIMKTRKSNLTNVFKATVKFKAMHKYHRAKFEGNSLNIIRDIASLKSSQVRHALVTLNEGQGHQTGNGHTDF